MQAILLLRCAIQRNNEGISHLENHDAMSAMRAFQTGIEYLSASERDEHCYSHHHDVTALTGFDDQQLPLLGVKSTDKLSYTEINVEASPYFYGRPIRIDQMWSEAKTSREITILYHQASCILLFNTALTYHLKCHTIGEGKFHQAAVKLYKVVLQLLGQMVGNTACDHSSTHWSRVLTVLVLNNCAEIHHEEECEYIKAQYELAFMTSLLSDQHELFTTSNLLSEEDLNGIITNATMLKPPEVARAA